MPFGVLARKTLDRLLEVLWFELGWRKEREDGRDRTDCRDDRADQLVGNYRVEGRSAPCRQAAGDKQRDANGIQITIPQGCGQRLCDRSLRSNEVTAIVDALLDALGEIKGP